MGASHQQMRRLPPRRPGLWILLAVSVCLAVAAPGLAAWGEIGVPRCGQVVAAGDLIEISWSMVPGEVEEVELLLSADGGRSFPVRLTPQLDPALRRLMWRVPDLPTTAACLRLRVGLEGREVEGPVGALFEIRARLDAPLAAARYCDGEWWVGCAPPRLEPEPLRGVATGVTAAIAGGPTHAATSDQTAREPRQPRGRRTSASLVARRTATERVLSRQPRAFPLLT